jgi:predicted MFS family arabinose efflux permease
MNAILCFTARPTKIQRLAFEGIARALSNRSYRLYATGNAISLIGFWLQKVAVGWLTWELTESGTWLGIMAIADALPATVLAPFSGVMADRFERIRLIRLTQLAQTTQAATLAILAFTGHIDTHTLLGLVVLLGVIQAFAQPVRLSLVPSLVRVEDLPSAIAINSSLFNLARFIGPAIAGFLITAYGVAAAIAGATLCFFVFLLIMLRVEPMRNEVTPGSGDGIWSDILEGFRYAIAHPGVGPILLLIVATTMFSRSFFDLLPGFADRVFDRGADGLAMLVASVGVGALLSSVWLAGRGHTAGLTRIAVGVLLVVAAAEAVFATTENLPVAMLSLTVLGFATVTTSITCQTLLQNTVDGHVRGRVMGLYGMAMRAGPAVGALALGSLSERFGLQATVLASAFCCALAWLWAQTHWKQWATVLERNPT